eukprot:CAMPEP_0172023546 /NCGR_PEP_ID=MMETSP1041-20130122/14847_1 /TAXON_ID=464988 /ORGANISM="Hemiselmis andersenii, Strain CCMP439" /LENGTH=221 /DNA_ID=CAMNT_0012679033 /DNA_START=107 /DNA_END=769 /DNA_ORIENTATION=+
MPPPASGGAFSAAKSFFNETFWRRAMWPVRTALACAAASLAFEVHKREDGSSILETRILAPVCAILCTSATLGETLKVAYLVSTAVITGGVAGEMFSLISHSEALIFALHVALSFAILMTQTKDRVVYTKICWVIVTIAFTTSLNFAHTGAPEGDELDEIDPLSPPVEPVSEAMPPFFVSKSVLSCLLGVSCSVAISLLPFPYSRAQSDAAHHLSECESKA